MMEVDIREGFKAVRAEIRCPYENAEVRRAARLLRSLGQEISGELGGKTYLLELLDILYVESVDRKSFVYTAEETYETALKLYEIEERFPDSSLFRSAKSQILNISHILALRPDFNGRLEVSLTNGEKLIVSRQYARQLKERIGL